jgi:lipid II:glycine glycyltransferase (peptidoglycan interpeptide bridge formation enzyme)
MLRTSKDIGMSVRPTFLGSLIKIQRPSVLTKDDLVEIDVLAKKARALIVKLEPSVGQDENILVESEYINSRFPQCPPSTMYLDLKLSKEDLWKNLSHSAKYSINRSIREGDKFEIYENPKGEVLESFYKIARETSQKKKFYMMPLADFVARIDVFKDKSYIALVRDAEGIVSGAKFFLEDFGMVLYVSGGTSSEARKHKSGYLLTWESMLYFKERGLLALDLEGMDDPRFPFYTKEWGGFSHFKEKFGGDIVRYPIPYIKYYHPLMKMLSKFAPLSL